MTTTTDQIQAEMEFRRQERIAILCGTEEPDAYALEQAEKDAVEWRDWYLKENPE
jgi:hypothetical protein